MRARLADSVQALRDGARRVPERLEALRALLWRSPYYREALRAAGLAPADLRGLADLPAFPLLDRGTLGRRWRDLPAVDDGVELVLAWSSGSTGVPITVVRDRYDEVHMWAVLGWLLERLGIALPDRPRVVLLDSLPGGRDLSRRVALFHRGALHRVWIHGPRPDDRLRRARPAILFGDPAGLHWLADRPAPPAPRLVLTSAQHFSRAQRAALAAVLPAPVVNYYSTTESGPIAWECLRAPEVFHVLVPDVWVEEVGGELVVTRLRPSALPLLRYRTGDSGALRAGPCACGHAGPSIVGFRGRRACDFVTPAGARVDAWQLAPLFRGRALTAFRLTQRGPRAFELELDGAADDVAAALRAALARLGWDGAEIALAPLLPGALAKPEPFRYADVG